MTKSHITAIFGITGWKNAGKTTLTERLVRELISRGFHVSTIKHAHHDFDIDVEGTDSWRHRKAGAGEVAVVSSRRFAIIHENRVQDEPSLDDILAKMAPADLILIEGYKQGNHAKLEVIRQASQKDKPIYTDNKTIVALATDATIKHDENPSGLPVFDVENIAAIADFIEHYCALTKAQQG